MYMSICWYLRVLPVVHRPEVVDIAVKSYIEKHAICLKDYRIRPFLSIGHAHGDLCKHLGIDSSTDLDDPLMARRCVLAWWRPYDSRAIKSRQYFVSKYGLSIYI